MNKSLLLISVVLVLLFASCKKNNSRINGTLVYNGCAAMVVKITDPEYFYLAQNEWTSIQGETFQHVFTIKNFCELREKLEKGDNLTFRIVSREGQNDCVYCLVFEAPPQKAYNIELVKSAD